MCITISIMLEKLRLFLVVLEEGSLRRAADRLRISQSAITRQMQSLELDLGVRVLEGTSAGVRPTNGGHALAQRAKTLLAAFISHLKVPNVVMVPIADAGATWDLYIVWQQGKMASPLPNSS